MSPLPPRLFCFHHAGAGGSAFARWQTVLGGVAEVVPVLLPGREVRIREERITDPARLLEELDTQLGPLIDRPYLLYGHSLGGLVALSYARARERAGDRLPELVMVGAATPPHLRSPLLPTAGLAEAGLLDLLASYGALPPGAREDSSLWRRRVLPTLRDDFRLAEALVGAARGAVLTRPLLAVAGRLDPIAPPAVMAEWDRCTTARFQQLTVDGDHFFVRARSTPERLRDLLVEALAVPAGIGV